MRYYLGLDGGGTKTAAGILDENRTERGRGQGGPCNIATGGLDSLRESVIAATRTALESAGLPADTRFEAVCAGVAGYTAKRRRAEFLDLLSDTVAAAHHRLEPDYVIAYWGATEGERGIIISAGTGAVVYGRNENGDTCRIDGRGFLLGDLGSGFDIARMALRWTLSIMESGKELKPFHVQILAAIGAEDVDDLIEWTYRDFSPSHIAGLAVIIGQLAADGDEDARAFVQGAGRDLRISFQQVVQRLRLDPQTTAYRLGSLWNLGEPLIAGFNRGFDQLSPPDPIKLLDPRHDAAHGAALLAMQVDQNG